MPENARGSPTESGEAAEAKPRRRQARGERRIAQLLEAAASVFCPPATPPPAPTPSPARPASPPARSTSSSRTRRPSRSSWAAGSCSEMRETHGAGPHPGEPRDLPLTELLDAVLDPFIAFNCENPAFFALMHGPDIPGRIAEEHDALHAALLTRVEELARAPSCPTRPPAELTRIATMIFAIFKAGLDLVLAHEGDRAATRTSRS